MKVIVLNGTRIAFVSRGNEGSFTTDGECSEQLCDLINFSQYLCQMLILSVYYLSDYTGLSVLDCVHNKEICYKSTMNIDLWSP